MHATAATSNGTIAVTEGERGCYSLRQCVKHAAYRGREIMKKLCLLATVATLWSAPILAQSADEPINAGKSTDNVLNHSMGYDRKSYSPLKEINKSNIKRLVPVWSTSLMNDSGELAAPAIYNGVMYVINGKWTFAIDLESGRQIWRTAVEFEPGALRVTQFGAFNRGAPTLYNGKLF